MTEHTDYLQIDIEKYVPIKKDTYISAPGDEKICNNNFSNKSLEEISRQNYQQNHLLMQEQYLLPIPANLQDTNNVQYDTSTLNGLAATGVLEVSGFNESLVMVVW